MAEQLSYLIIGNGIAGVTAAEVLRAEDSAASIAVIADDPFPVYYRPALKDYLGGKVREDKLLARPSSFYQDRNIYFLKDRVTGIQTTQHAVQLQSGKQVGYKRLLLAHGAYASTLRCPGVRLEGVSTLRTVLDYQRVLTRLNTVQRVVIVGSGTLALETVETLRYRGYEVTHLIRRRSLWSDILDQTASDLVLQQEGRDGVDVRLDTEIAEIFGEDGQVRGIITNRGEEIRCEMVLIAVGIQPITKFVKASGIECQRGILVDDMMQTNAPDVYAAGDVLETKDPLTGKSRVVGQWYPAIQQARAAAYSMLDRLDAEQPFRATTFYNATFLYGLDFASVGITTIRSKSIQELVADPKPRIYRKVLLKDGVPIGMLALGDRRQALAFKRAIDHRVNLQPVTSRLFDDDFNLNDWLNRQGVPPPLLGAVRAGANAVKRAAYVKPAPAPAIAQNGATEKRIPAAKDSGSMDATVRLSEQSGGAMLIHEPDRVSGLQLPNALLSQTQVITVGRQPGVQLFIEQGSVSRRHAEISYANEQYMLQDLGSTNGTFVNETRLPPQRPYALKAGDVVRFGNLVKFKFLPRPTDGQEIQDAPKEPSMAGIAFPQNATSMQDSLVQPVLNTNGSLSFPGSSSAVPADMVEAFKTCPALVILPRALEGKTTAPRVFMLKQEKRITLGREKGNDIEIDDAAISRKHAEVLPGPDGFYMRDLGSSNGVSVNQTKIDNPYLLSHGDRIVMGGSIVYFINLQAAKKQAAFAQIRVPQEEETGPNVRTSTVPSAPPAETIRVDRQLAGNAIEQMKGEPEEAPSSVVICRKCGAINTPVARFCASCSASLRSAVRQGGRL